MCVCFCLCCIWYCVTNNICMFYSVLEQQRGSSPLFYFNVAQSVFSRSKSVRVCVSPFMQSHMLQCGSRDEGNVQLYFIYYTTTWWQSINLLAAAACCAVPCRQLPASIYVYGSLFLFSVCLWLLFLPSSLMQSFF